VPEEVPDIVVGHSGLAQSRRELSPEVMEGQIDLLIGGA
jgi:hypothetical protein